MPDTRARVAALLGAAVLCVSTAATITPADAAPPARHFANCKAMNKVYKHGVGRTGARDHVSGRSKPVTTFLRNNKIYAANTARDGDKDKIACEKH